MRRTVTIFLMPALILFLGFSFMACSSSGDEAGAAGSVDEPTPGPVGPGGDDDDTAGDDDSGDDDSGPPSSDYIVIHKPTMDQIIVGTDVPVHIEFGGSPDNPAVTLDDLSINITESGLWFYESPDLYGTIQGVEAGEHILTASANYSKSLEQESVRFETTLEGYVGRIELNLNKYTIDPGQSLQAGWDVFDAAGNVITESVDVTLSTDPTNGVTITGRTLTFAEGGTFWVIASTVIEDTPVSDSKRVSVGAGASDVARVEIDCTPKNLNAGDTSTCNGTAYDENDNVVNHAIVYTLTPEDSGEVQGNEITVYLAAQLTVHGTAWGTEMEDTVRLQVSPGSAHDVMLMLDPDEIEVDEISTAAVNVVDRWDNPISEIDDVTLTSTPSQGVDIDGMEITPHVSADIVVNARATHQGSIVEDQAVLHVSDSFAPIIDLISPERGQFITATNNITVTGTVYDEHGSIESFTLNGMDVYFDDLGRFTETVTLEVGLNTLVFTAEDNSGNTVHATLSVMYAPTYLQNGNGVNKAIGARVNQLGLDSVEEIAELYVQEEIEAQLAGMFPLEIFHESYEIWGFNIFEGQAEVTGVSLDPVNVELTPFTGGIRAAGIVTNIEAQAYLYYDIFDKETGEKFGSTEYFTITVDNATVSMDLLVTASGGDLDVTVDNVTVSISTINVNINGSLFGDILGWLVEELANGFALGIVEDLIRDTINEIVPPLIELALQGLDLHFDLSLLGFEYHLYADFSEVDFDNTGGDIWLHAYLWYDDGSWTPSPNVPELPGSLLTDNGEPTFGVFVPGTSNPYGFGVALGDDILNQFLHTVHRSGMLSLNLDQETLEQFGIEDFELTTGWLGAFFPGLWAEYGFNEEVVIKMRPLLPPVFNVNPQKAGSLTTEIQLGDFVLEFSSMDESWAKLALAAYMPTELSVSEEQTISLAFGDIELYTDLFDTLEGIRANETLFEQLMPNLVQALLPLLLSGVLEEFPIPSFEGFTLNVESFQKFGPGQDWIGLFGSLVQTPAEQLLQQWLAQEAEFYRGL
ncbi:MAG: hypothetical protein P9L99_20555 [Candidatus Lernaella stagnicola]|nr:hypothetical protein [Candidatus Lernaella stagnicola]